MSEVAAHELPAALRISRNQGPSTGEGLLWAQTLAVFAGSKPFGSGWV